MSPALAQGLFHLGWDGISPVPLLLFPRSSVAPATPEVLPELRKPKARCTFQLCPCCARQTHEGNPNVSEGMFCIEHSRADRDCLVNILNIHVFLVFVTELCRVLPPANLPGVKQSFHPQVLFLLCLSRGGFPCSCAEVWVSCVPKATPRLSQVSVVLTLSWALCS